MPFKLAPIRFLAASNSTCKNSKTELSKLEIQTISDLNATCIQFDMLLMSEQVQWCAILGAISILQHQKQNSPLQWYARHCAKIAKML